MNCNFKPAQCLGVCLWHYSLCGMSS